MTNPETGYEKAHRQVEQIFRQFFPARGMVTREGQIRLCHMMLDALFGLDVALCDAGVGLGKTYAYLVACVLWQLQRPRQMQRPVVISTASVALQSAILTEYIPFLSNVLIQNGYIQKPICAVLRKGKERFACDRTKADRHSWRTVPQACSCLARCQPMPGPGSFAGNISS